MRQIKWLKNCIIIRERTRERESCVTAHWIGSLRSLILILAAAYRVAIWANAYPLLARAAGWKMRKRGSCRSRAGINDYGWVAASGGIYFPRRWYCIFYAADRKDCNRRWLSRVPNDFITWCICVEMGHTSRQVEMTLVCIRARLDETSKYADAMWKNGCKKSKALSQPPAVKGCRARMMIIWSPLKFNF